MKNNALQNLLMENHLKLKAVMHCVIISPPSKLAYAQSNMVDHFNGSFNFTWFGGKCKQIVTNYVGWL